jgi:hypothetical protein
LWEKKIVGMKRIFVLLATSLIVTNSIDAQTWEEWFEQKKTQKKYLLQQIAALQIYLNYARKGYDIANKGITTVRNIKRGDFNLHRDFLNSLKNINPRISKYAKVADIIAYQVKIVKQAKLAIAHIKESKQFTQTELDYCKNVFDYLLDKCVKTIDELILVTTAGELEMSDDERLKRIDMLYLDMQDKYSFCCSFSEEMGLMAFQRLGEQIEINRSKISNNVK